MKIGGRPVRRSSLFGTLLVLMLLGAVLGHRLWLVSQVTPLSKEDLPRVSPVSEKMPLAVAPAQGNTSVSDAKTLPAHVEIEEVPFIVQAPFAEWQNPVFQDACEEASVTIAQAWVTGRTLTTQKARADIVALTDFQVKRSGQAVDTSITDTQGLLDNFYQVSSSRVERGVTVEKMEQLLAEGDILLAPTDGRLLHNPNFKQPGPTRHMIVIIGYDREKKEFIVNDPGTRKGAGYRYPEDTVYDAMIDYATGDHVPLSSTDKVLLAVWRGK